MEKKNIQPKKVIASSLKTTLKNISQDTDPILQQLMSQIEQLGIKTTGPLEFIYKGVTQDMEKEFDLEIVQPVDMVDAIELKSFTLKETPIFKAMTHTYVGSMDDHKMFAIYGQIFEELGKQNIQPTDMVREVYENWVSISSDENIVEIQIGIN